MANSIESTFAPAFEEIARRRTAAHEYASSETTHFARAGDACALPFELPDQRVVLLSMGTRVLAPCPEDATRPALRVYGAFPTREDAVEHADIVRELDPACSLLVVDRAAWTLMPQSETTRDDRVANQARVEALLEAYRGRVEAEQAAFDRAVLERSSAPAPSSMSSVPEDEAEQEEAEQLVYKPPRRLRSGAEVRGQAVTALCAVPDAEGGECLVRVLGCFENTAAAELWVRNVASRTVTDHDILLAPTCDWLFPNGKANGATHYRIDELQRIMDTAERNPEVVRSYKDWKREQEAKGQQFDGGTGDPPALT